MGLNLFIEKYNDYIVNFEIFYIILRGNEMKNFVIAVIIVFLSVSISFANDQFLEHTKVVFKTLEKVSTAENYDKFMDSLSDAKAIVNMYRHTKSKTKSSGMGQLNEEKEYLCHVAIANCITQYELAESYWKTTIYDCNARTSYLDFCKEARYERHNNMREGKKLLDERALHNCIKPAILSFRASEARHGIQ